jgi:GT2 family glycosyltransferase
MKEILLVCATRMNRADFRRRAHLFASLKKLRGVTSKVSSRITYQNRHGLGTIYNRYLKPRYADKILVFVHDDARIEDLFFVDKLNQATQEFDLIGVAGNQQPDINDLSWFDPERPLAGFVAHHNPGRRGRPLPRETVFVSSYGPTPAKCGLLDGVFLAVNTEKVISCGVKFDEQFEFHFYDLDFCLSCLAGGLRMGTWPIWIVHQSGGSFDSPDWRRAARLYERKWIAKES